MSKQDPFEGTGQHEEQWTDRLERDETGAVDACAALEKCRNAIDAMEIAAEVHPLGPAILILKGRGMSNAKIAERVKTSDVTVGTLLKKISQLVTPQLP